MEEMDHTPETVDKREVTFTYEELLIQNRSLSDELAQCRADKDFVWTLWKRLQADKPDFSSAVSMVISREQEKAEVKDQKVLIILKEKDNNIKILQEIAADLEVQLKQSMERLSGLLVERTEWEGKLADLQRTVDKVNEEKDYQQEVIKAKGVQNEAEKNSFLSKIENLERVNKELEKQAGSLQEEIEKVGKINSAAESTMEANAALKDKLEMLEKDLEDTRKKKNEKDSALQSCEAHLLTETAMVKEQAQRIQQKDTEIATLNAELKKKDDDYREYFEHVKEQNEIVKNLQLLQDETQQVLKNQQDSHKMEVKSFKITLKELRQKCIDLQSSNEKLYGETETLRQSLHSHQKKGTEKDTEIADLKESLSRRFEGYDSETQTMDQDCNRCRELEEKLEEAIEETDNMKDIVHERGRRISSLEKVLNERRKRNIAIKEAESDITIDQSGIENITEKLKAKIDVLEREVEDLDALLSLKDNELQETKKAHSRRLQRYKSLRENYVIINQQLRTFGNDSAMLHQSSISRADPKSLQHENSDSVWNELAFFRKQYQTLKKEREEFEEEIDTLRVKSAEKDVQMKQAELRFHEEQEECSRLREVLRSKQKFISPSKLYSSESQVEVLRSKTKQLERQKEALQTENQALKQREKYYKEEIVNLSDEIDSIHRNIKAKIDAEVQASEVMITLEKESNRSLDKLADSITANVYPRVEQYIQTSPISPFKKRSPLRSMSLLTQSTQTTNSEEESSSSERINKSPKKLFADKFGRERNLRKNKLLLIGDLKMPRDGKRQKTDQVPSPAARGSILKRRRMPPKSSPAVKEHTSLKVRVLSLEQQVDVLRNAKIKLSQELQEKKVANETIEEELNSTCKKLEMNRITIRKLSGELERANQQREELENGLEVERRKNKLPEIGYKELENRWKLATNESAKLSFQVKTLRGENEMLIARQKEFQERIIWLERQLNQKKQLMEEFKEKLKENTETLAKDKEHLEETKRKNKALTVNAEQRKKFVEDLRSKINEISLEKVKLKEELSQCQEELRRKSHLLQQSQNLCNHAEKAVSEMEKAAFDQLHEQALQQDKIQKKMNADMSNVNKRTQEYQLIIKNFVEAVLKDAHRLRVLISERRRQRRKEEQKRQNGREAMKEARDLACSILNMTSEDLKSLMEDEEEMNDLIETNDNDIREKLDEYLKQETKFSKHVLSLLFQLLERNWSLKLQEYVELNQWKEMQSPIDS